MCEVGKSYETQSQASMSKKEFFCTFVQMTAPLWLFEGKVGDSRDGPLNVEVGIGAVVLKLFFGTL